MGTMGLDVWCNFIGKTFGYHWTKLNKQKLILKKHMLIGITTNYVNVKKCFAKQLCHIV